MNYFLRITYLFSTFSVLVLIPSIQSMELEKEKPSSTLQCSTSTHKLSELLFQIKTYGVVIPKEIESILGADIGGTYSDFGIFDIHNEVPRLLFSFHTETKLISNFPGVVHDIVKYAQNAYSITIKNACFAAPGVATAHKDYAAVRKFFEIKSKEVREQCDLKVAFVVNDFFVIGHGLKLINQDKIVQLYGDKPPKERGCCGIIGAGSGLGSAFLTWDSKTQSYVVHPSESGALEFAPMNKLEYEIANHIKNMYSSFPITCWGYLVSGIGIKRIYSILKLMGKHKDSLQLDIHDPAVIFAHPEDELCKATIELFFKLYARFAHNFIFTTLPYDGLYIAGGIAAKNINYFATLFIPEYENCEASSQALIKRIPLYVITDYNVSLYGAVDYLLKENKTYS